ncbi:MAG: helix-turn-helix domain-containing protein [Lachnospiraceae bacterium]|nr:helix-turn-helix domain-containing protein [Lachnospiraceae bacterium]
MTLYEELTNGLNSAIKAHRSGKKLKATTIRIPELKRYTAKDIKRIRKAAGLTQEMLALFMGVSVKTVEAWERGVNRPTGPACRLFSMLEEETIIIVT